MCECSNGDVCDVMAGGVCGCWWLVVCVWMVVWVDVDDWWCVWMVVCVNVDDLWLCVCVRRCERRSHWRFRSWTLLCPCIYVARTRKPVKPGLGNHWVWNVGFKFKEGWCHLVNCALKLSSVATLPLKLNSFVFLALYSFTVINGVYQHQMWNGYQQILLCMNTLGIDTYCVFT